MNEIINDNTILILPNNIKHDTILSIREKHPLYNIKFFTLEEFIKKLTFDYDEQTIYEISKEENINPELAKIYIENFYYIDKPSKNNKINNIYELKNKVNNYLIKDNLFERIIQDKNIIIYGYDYITKFQKQILYKLPNVNIIEKKYNNYTHSINKFNSLENEVIFVAENIAKLVAQGIDINNIYISNLDSNYHSVIKRIFRMYNIPINLNSKINILETNIGKYFINNLDNNIEKIFNDIKNKFDLNNTKNKNIYEKLYDIINKFYFTEDYLIVKDQIKNVMKNTYIKEEIYNNAVNEINILNNIISDDKYIFLLNFSQNTFPSIKKDDDYIEDNIKPSYLETTDELNSINKDIYYKAISNIKNLIITFKEKFLNESFYPSVLVDEYNLNVIDSNIYKSEYSNDLNKLLLTKSLDSLIKFNEYKSNLDVLYNNYKISYKVYDNKYKKININSLYKYLNNKLTLSYSSIDNFYHCSFKYYISNILNLNYFEDTIQTYIGNLYHYILSKAFLDNFNFDNEINNYLKNNPYPQSNKSKHFLEKNIDDLKNIISLIDYQNKLINYDSSLYEKKINVEKNKVINIDFKGFIDKILKLKDLIIIIDYKTYSIDIKLNHLPYGLSMQLPIYLYLTKNMDHNAKVIGIYLQQVLFNKFNKDKNKTVKEQLKNSLKLKGYSIGNETLLEEFDPSYKDSEVIQGMKLTSKGFGAYSKVLTEKQLDNVYKLTEKKIDECIYKIINADFDINPKKIDGENIGCKFCKFSDICYVNNKDIQELEEITNLDFLN